MFYLYFNFDVFSGLPDFWHSKLWRPFSKGRSWSQFFHVFSAGQHSRNLFNADGLFLSELLGPQDLVEQIERTFRRWSCPGILSVDHLVHQRVRLKEKWFNILFLRADTRWHSQQLTIIDQYEISIFRTLRNWENPLRGVPDLMEEVLNNLLDCCSKGNAKDYQDLISRLWNSNMENISWMSKAKYPPMVVLLPRIGITKVIWKT